MNQGAAAISLVATEKLQTSCNAINDALYKAAESDAYDIGSLHQSEADRMLHKIDEAIFESDCGSEAFHRDKG